MPIAAENPLGLRIPERSPESGEGMFRPKEIELWLQRLPVASGTQMASKLFRAIQEMNRTQIPPHNRIQIAESFTQPLKRAISTQVGIQSPGNPSDYGLAAIRWMQNDTQQGLQIGLQLLAPRVLPVSATLTERDRRTPVQCLLVPELKSADRPASLVTLAMPFKVKANVQIRHSGMEQSVRLVRLLESTGVFSQFQIEYG